MEKFVISVTCCIVTIDDFLTHPVTLGGALIQTLRMKGETPYHDSCKVVGLFCTIHSAKLKAVSSVHIPI